MHVEAMKTTNKVVPFQRKVSPSTVTLQVSGCTIHGIPEHVTVKELETLVAVAKYAEANQFENYWFNPNQSYEAITKGGEKDVVNYALKWLNTYLEWRFDEDRQHYFAMRLAKLPTLHQAIINKKYVEVDSEGKQNLDDFVYGELHIGRTYYYKKKKEALYLLGKALL